ncbi:DNA-binding IclR family transcriptional regulator [Ottowia thiooxydans]|uniref:DNA-binding IclR family transcriptional regulator n=1 Tax=Ottowia thiooxydans TaxID=219182 RepID=A0ABV2QBR4_9BURK
MGANYIQMEHSAKLSNSDANLSIRTRNRTLHILQLFERRSLWTVEDIALEMGVSISSAYRDVKELSNLGFLALSARSEYMLGPAFIRYDLLIRQGDPLVKAASEPMLALLARTTQHAVVLISRRFRDQVMCVHQEKGSDHPPSSTYERGVALPMFKGATSKAILAHLGDRALKQIYLNHEHEIRESTGVGGWKAFSEQMKAIREAGVACTDSEVAPGRIGIAAPVFWEGQVVAGVSLVFELTQFDQAGFAAEVRRSAREISAALESVKTP